MHPERPNPLNLRSASSDMDRFDTLMETLGRSALDEIKLRRFQLMLEPVLDSNLFYQEKLGAAAVSSAQDIRTFSDYQRLPFTTKQELAESQANCPPYGANLTFPIDRYTRIHQTSGTTGQPLRCLATAASWRWWANCWRLVYEAAGLGQTAVSDGHGTAP